jgi:hypothetical protein
VRIPAKIGPIAVTLAQEDQGGDSLRVRFWPVLALFSIKGYDNVTLFWGHKDLLGSDLREDTNSSNFRGTCIISD